MAETSRLDVLRVFCAEDGSGGNPLGVFFDGAEVPEERRQAIARDLGFAETVFVDDAERAELRIFTPEMELPFAGHPAVGTAWLLRERGFEPEALITPAGRLPVRFDGGQAAVSAEPDWGPPFEFAQVDAPHQVEAVTEAPDGYENVGVWAWIDEERGVLRERVFVPGVGLGEDEATGAAALRLCAQLEREIEIRQGRGSVIYAAPAEGGLAEIRGRVVAVEQREHPIGG
jgi:predicted PhzF superfamily epimerase YddE/YHI9